jgi:hypothetical protein
LHLGRGKLVLIEFFLGEVTKEHICNPESVNESPMTVMDKISSRNG